MLWTVKNRGLSWVTKGWRAPGGARRSRLQQAMRQFQYVTGRGCDFVEGGH